jgi:hypothetical protein
MRNTKIILAMLATVLLTWLTLALIGYLLDEQMTFREACKQDGLILIMLTVGWIPSVVVGFDLQTYYLDK